MPWRLVGLILILALLMTFIGFNLNNTCDISLGFTRFSGVPVYLTVFASFVLGLLFSLPFIVFLAVKKSRPGKSVKPKKDGAQGGTAPAGPSPKKPGTEGRGID